MRSAGTPRSCAAMAISLSLSLLRRMKRRAAQHDRHAAADRAVARQRIERIRAHHAHACRDRPPAPRRPRCRPCVSWPCPADVVCMVAVIEPTRSTLMRQESIQVVVPFFGIEQRLERRIAAARLQAGGDADAREHALARAAGRARRSARRSRPAPAPCRSRRGSRRCRRSSRSGSDTETPRGGSCCGGAIRAGRGRGGSPPRPWCARCA